MFFVCSYLFSQGTFRGRFDKSSVNNFEPNQRADKKRYPSYSKRTLGSKEFGKSLYLIFSKISQNSMIFGEKPKTAAGVREENSSIEIADPALEIAFQLGIIKYFGIVVNER